jgi:hypothetical protein
MLATEIKLSKVEGEGEAHRIKNKTILTSFGALALCLMMMNTSAEDGGTFQFFMLLAFPARRHNLPSSRRKVREEMGKTSKHSAPSQNTNRFQLSFRLAEKIARK